MLGCCITVTGWTFAEVRAAAWADIWQLWHYWSENPPPHILMSAGVGAGYPMKRRRTPTAAEKTILQTPATKSTDAYPAPVQDALRRMRKGLATKQ